MINNITLLRLSIVLQFFAISLFCQDDLDKDKSFYYDYGNRFYVEAHLLPSESKDSVKIISMFKFANSILNFVKTDNEYRNNGTFCAFPQLEIEFKDSLGIIKKRETWKDTIYLNNYDETKSKSEYTYGNISLVLPAGKYDLNIELSDNGRIKLKEEKLPRFADIKFFNSPSISHPIFTYLNNKDVADSFNSYYLGNDIGFTSNSASILIAVTYKDNFTKFNYSINSTEPKSNSLNWGNPVNINGVLTPEEDATLGVQMPKVGKCSIDIYKATFQPEKNNGFHTGILEIQFSADKILPGWYELKVWRAGDSDTMTHLFRVIWEDMPLSLKNPEYSADLMYNILTDDEYDHLKSGSSKEIFRKILAYWQKFDPTPNTLFNEAMAQFFTRVDYAFFNYQTITEKDGAKTERGKIYILNGAPSKVDRNMSTDGKIREAWKYAKLKKEYIFETGPSGEFQLKSINDIN